MPTVFCPPVSTAAGRPAKTALAMLAALVSILACGCANKEPEARQGEEGATIEQLSPITESDARLAVLSLHRKIAFADACKFGLTLTNRLPYAIGNIALRFTPQTTLTKKPPTILRNFFEMGPGESQYREVAFEGLTCDRIKSLQITDPGRCELGTLKRPSSQPGECTRFVQLAENPYVRLVLSPIPGRRTNRPDAPE